MLAKLDCRLWCLVLVATSLGGCFDGGDAEGSAAGEGPTAVDLGPCLDGDPNRERWGSNCVCCHETEFGVAGSLLPDSAVETIFVADQRGRSAEMSPNFFDNFFRHQKLTPPLTATITFSDGEQRRMQSAALHGSCNACHGQSEPMLGSR